MKLENLSLKECVLLARRAEMACARIFRQAGQRIDRALEPELFALTRRLAAEEEGHLAALDEFSPRVPWPPIWQLTETGIDRMIHSHFPALATRFDDGPVSREAVLEFAEHIEQQSFVFYTMLARVTPQPEAKALFSRLAHGERKHLERIGTVAAR